MKYQVEDIAYELQALLDAQLAYMDQKVFPLSNEDLTWRPGEFRWNLLEVTEHMIRFGDHYLPKLVQAMSYPKSLNKPQDFSSGIIAERFNKIIRPVNGEVRNKSKAAPKANPFLRQLDRSVLVEHKEQQEKLKSIIDNSRGLNWSKNNISSMLHPWFKMGFGDSLRLMIYHQERHYIQIDNLIKKKI